MGTTLTTLNLYGVDRSAVESLLDPSDLLRDQNPPWLTVVPPHETEERNPQRLERLAARLTKDSDAAALLFYYFDDDLFTCSLYHSGRRSASCESAGSWAKLGKKLSALYGDDAPSKAFRYASHCINLEEQLRLLEETVGTALYDLQQGEPRTIAKTNKTLCEIKAREAMLRKRPNRFALTELAPEDWPIELKCRNMLLELLRPRWKECHLSFLLYAVNAEQYLVPGGNGLFAYYYSEDLNKDFGKLMLLNGNTGEYLDNVPLNGIMRGALWQTKNREIAILLVRRVRPELACEHSPCVNQKSSVVCIDTNGVERWGFEPQFNAFQHIEHVHTSEKGIITLFAPGIDAIIKADALIFQIDGETGELLRTRRYPYKDNVHNIVHVNDMGTFLFCKRSSGTLVLLNEELDEIRAIPEYNGSAFFRKENLCGSLLWSSDWRGMRYVSVFDLQDGTTRNLPLEIPAYPVLMLPSGEILAKNDRMNRLIVFDQEGKVAARCSVPGMLNEVFLRGGKAYLVEVRGPDTHGLIYEELFDETTTHLWQLDAVSAETNRSLFDIETKS